MAKKTLTQRDIDMEYARRLARKGLSAERIDYIMTATGSDLSKPSLDEKVCRLGGDLYDGFSGTVKKNKTLTSLAVTAAMISTIWGGASLLSSDKAKVSQSSYDSAPISQTFVVPQDRDSVIAGYGDEIMSRQVFANRAGAMKDIVMRYWGQNSAEEIKASLYNEMREGGILSNGLRPEEKERMYREIDSTIATMSRSQGRNI